MRRANKPEWIRGTGGAVIGINLGSDFCAEHEWGIKGLRAKLGVSAEKIAGIEGRRCKNPSKETIRLVEAGGTLNLIVADAFGMKYALKNLADSKPHFEYAMRNENLVTAWDENELIVRVKGEREQKWLRELHDALVVGNAAMWLGGGGVFANSGLCLAVIEKVSAADKKTMKKADDDRTKLQEAADKTGIKQKIDALNAGKGRSAPCLYFALSPSWYNGEGKTKYPVCFWLNPMEQDENNYGYFTVEELEQWMEGKGPIKQGDE